MIRSYLKNQLLKLHNIFFMQYFPVTISISSDEEEEPEKSSVPGSTATGSVSMPVAEKDDIGQLLDSIPQNKRPASPTAQAGSRVVKMEDEVRYFQAKNFKACNLLGYCHSVDSCEVSLGFLCL